MALFGTKRPYGATQAAASPSPSAKQENKTIPLKSRQEKPIRVEMPTESPKTAPEPAVEAPKPVIEAQEVKVQEQPSKEAEVILDTLKKESQYRVLPSGSVGGIAIYGAEPRMQEAYRRFVRDGIRMGEYVALAIPGGMSRFVSPLSMKFASGLLDAVLEMMEKDKIKRIACIVRREEIDMPIVRHLLPVPSNMDFATYALSMAKKMLDKKMGINVEFYLAEVKEDGEIEFFKLD